MEKNRVECLWRMVAPCYNDRCVASGLVCKCVRRRISLFTTLHRATGTMPRDIDGVRYYSTAEVLSQLGISRQTLWRWRRQGKVPQGRRFRGRAILFTGAEVERIRDYANRLEPADVGSEDRQLRLFKNGDRGAEG